MLLYRGNPRDIEVFSARRKKYLGTRQENFRLSSYCKEDLVFKRKIFRDANEVPILASVRKKIFTGLTDNLENVG